MQNFKFIYSFASLVLALLGPCASNAYARVAIQGACRNFGLSFRQQGAITPEFDAVLECEMKDGRITLRAFAAEAKTEGDRFQQRSVEPGVFEITVIDSGDVNEAGKSVPLGKLQIGENRYEVMLKKPAETPKSGETPKPAETPKAAAAPVPVASLAAAASPSVKPTALAASLKANATSPAPAASQAPSAEPALETPAASTAPAKRSQRPPFFVFLGPTFVSYSQTGVSPLSQTSLGTRVSYTAPGTMIGLAPALELGGTIQFLALPVVTSVSGVSLGFASVHLHGGYSFSWPGPAWRLGFFAGPYYMTTWSKGGDFGFRNLIGAHFDSRLSRSISPTRSGSFLLRFSPVASLSDSEIAGRVSLSQIVRTNHLMNFSVDVARLGIHYPDGRQFSSLSISAVVGYGL